MRALIVCLFLCGSFNVLAAGLVGRWSGPLDGETLVLELRADGSGVLDGEPIQYQQLGNQLLVQLDGEVIAYAVQQTGDQMIVTGGDLEVPVTFRRGGKAAAGNASASATGQPQRQSAPSGANAGGLDPSMVGRWCYVASFSANQGGGSQSSRCFDLRGDGSYSYSSEGSISAYGSGMWGGTTSSNSDSGRWSASGGSITAQSVSGAVNTYPLEKRNHPKTRDPMLCLDGDCYVTQFQKAPW